MSEAIIMIHISVTNFVLISWLEEDHSMIETCRLKNVFIFFQTIISFVLPGKKYSMYCVKYLLLGWKLCW